MSKLQLQFPSQLTPKHMILTRNILKRFSSETTKQIIRYQHLGQLQCKQLIRKQNPLRNIIMQQLDQLGEMKLQKYWKLALTDSDHGYYSKDNVFSKEGDFTTSPQISPLFGQMIAVWILYFLQKTGVIDKATRKINRRFRIIELGGGRGLLMKDIINSFRDSKITDGFDINFVEMSQRNRQCQQESVMQAFKKNQHFFRFEHEKANQSYQSFVSQNQDKSVKIQWFNNIQGIFYEDSQYQKNNESAPFTVFVMNQFMDALPTTILKYTKQGWRQKVVTRSIHDELYFDLGISQNPVPQKLMPEVTQDIQQGTQIEISPQSLLTMDLMAKMINKSGGAIINVDYGDDGYFNDSIRGIKNHKYVPHPYFWQLPGECDISAYVNFKSLAQFAEKNTGIIAYETIPQGYFLEAMGIVHRVDLLKQKADQQAKKRLDSEQQRLVDPSQMGQIYKVQIITKKQYGQVYPFIQVNEYQF